MVVLNNLTSYCSLFMSITAVSLLWLFFMLFSFSLLYFDGAEHYVVVVGVGGGTGVMRMVFILRLTPTPLSPWFILQSAMLLLFILRLILRFCLLFIFIIIVNIGDNGDVVYFASSVGATIVLCVASGASTVCISTTALMTLCASSRADVVTFYVGAGVSVVVVSILVSSGVPNVASLYC